jgi:CP family cyanate transporter-like MFS transporter
MAQKVSGAIAESTYRPGPWLLVLGIVLIASNLRAPITSVGPVVKNIRLDTGLSNTLTGLLTTLPLVSFALVSPFAPRLAHRFGMEKTLLGGLVVLGVGVVLRAVPNEIVLFGGTALVGMGIAIGNVLLPGFVKREFPRQAGIMTGVFIVCMGVGAALGSGLSIPLAEVFGWRGMLAGWAILSVIAILIWLPSLKFSAPVARPRGKNSTNDRSVAPVGKLWRSWLAWQITLFMGLQSLIFYVMVAWLPEILNQWGLDTGAAGWLLSLFQFVGLPASFVMPVLAGRGPNQRRLVIITALAMLIGYCGMLFFNTTLLAVWILLTGFGSGATIGLALTFFVLRAHNPHQTAALSGMAQSVGYLLAAIGPTLFGFLHDQTGGWDIPLILLIVFTVLFLLVGLGAGSPGYVSEAPAQAD